MPEIQPFVEESPVDEECLPGVRRQPGRKPQKSEKRRTVLPRTFIEPQRYACLWWLTFIAINVIAVTAALDHAKALQREVRDTKTNALILVRALMDPKDAAR
jgi:hypothetical protein